MSSTRVVYQPRADATPEAELSTLTAVYRYVLFDSQARRGDQHDLTTVATKECTPRPDKKGKDSADVHRDGI